MKTLWNEIQQIEDYLQGVGDLGERAVFSARLHLEPDLKESLDWQQSTYKIVHDYGRQKLNEDIAKVAHQLFHTKEHASFRQMILGIFRN